MNLFARIETQPAHAFVFDLDVVPVECASEVRFAVGNDGRRWFAKRCNGGDIVAEACGWLLARELDVPVVRDVRVVTDEEGLWWLGEPVAGAKHFNVEASQSIVNASALGAMFSLDALLGNEDRHAGNILVAPDGTGRRFVAIDFAGSWCSRPTSFFERGVEVPHMNSLAEGLTRGLLETSARAAATRIVELSDRTVSGIAYEACRVANYGQPRDLEEAILARAGSLHDILEALLEKLP